MIGLKKSVLWGARRIAKASGLYGGDYGKSPEPNGLVSGTRVATQYGWCDAAKVVPGDRVLTFDEGLQVVQAVRHRRVAQLPDCSLLEVPALSLGNREKLFILASQDVMIESDMAEELVGDPFAPIPALALEGLRGIERVTPDEELTVVTIEFSQDQVVYANVGTLFLCPSGEQLNMVEVAGLDLPPYEALPMFEARILAEAFATQDDAHSLPQEYAAA